MKIYIHRDTGSAYRINSAGYVEYRPLSIGNEVMNTVGESGGDEWAEVEYGLVGEETVRHEGGALTIYELEPIIRTALGIECINPNAQVDGELCPCPLHNNER